MTAIDADAGIEESREEGAGDLGTHRGRNPDAASCNVGRVEKDGFDPEVFIAYLLLIALDRATRRSCRSAVSGEGGFGKAREATVQGKAREQHAPISTKKRSRGNVGLATLWEQELVREQHETVVLVLALLAISQAAPHATHRCPLKISTFPTSLGITIGALSKYTPASRSSALDTSVMFEARGACAS